MYIIGDVHGAAWTLIKLLKRLPKEAHKVFVGDLVDRGNKSFETVMLVKAMCQRGEASCVLGNHEDFMLGANEEWWEVNGGKETLHSYDIQPNGMEKFIEHQEWMNTLPIYLEFPEVLIGPDKRMLVISHSCIYSYWEHRRDIGAKQGILWGRDFFDVDKDFGIYNVFGHTPVEEPVIKEWGAMIDTGCIFGKKEKHNKPNVLGIDVPTPKSKFAKLTAFNPITGEIVQEERDSRDK